MLSLTLRRTSSAAGEQGSVAVEAAIALPIAISLLLLFQDSLVVSYHMLTMRYAVQEGLRTGLLGPQCRTTGCDSTSHLVNAEAKANEVATRLGIKGSSGFMNNMTAAYDEVSGSELKFEATESGTCSESDMTTCRLTITATKTFKVTPAGGLLLSLGGAGGAVKLTRSDMALVER